MNSMIANEIRQSVALMRKIVTVWRELRCARTRAPALRHELRYLRVCSSQRRTCMAVPAWTRRGALGAMALPFVGALGSLGACSTPLPLTGRPTTIDTAAERRLLQSAEVHGLDAYRRITDINIAYDGQWRPLINGIQPEVVDAGFRGNSQERLMPALGINAQHYQGPKGRKFVAWRRGADRSGDGQVGVWFNGQPSGDKAMLTAAALVAEVYGLFLLGPLWLMDAGRGQRSGRVSALQLASTENVDGDICDVLQAWLVPGWGLSAVDRVALCISRADHVTRRMRFTLEGFAGTQGAVAETDTYDHQQRHGVLWPMRSFERVVHPIAVPAHDWRITGLDINRGYGASALSGPQFSGAALAPAKPV
jgi:hypothetical protein